jgi:hypothetical protein
MIRVSSCDENQDADHAPKTSLKTKRNSQTGVHNTHSGRVSAYPSESSRTFLFSLAMRAILASSVHGHWALVVAVVAKVKEVGLLRQLIVAVTAGRASVEAVAQ